MKNAGMSRVPRVPSLFRRVGFSFLLGFGLFFLGAMVERLLRRGSGTAVAVYLDNVVLGLLAGVVVFIYEQRRSRDIRQKLAVIAAMNHHVRNALQAISYAPYTEQAKQIELIQQSVSRIQWTLQEILPGGSEEVQKVAKMEDRLSQNKVDRKDDR